MSPGASLPDFWDVGVSRGLSCRCAAVIHCGRRRLSDCSADIGDDGLGAGGLDTVGLSWTSWDMIEKVRGSDQRFCGVTDAGRTERGFHAVGNGEFAGERLFRWVGMNGL
jgi:hypothetical protein